MCVLMWCCFVTQQKTKNFDLLEHWGDECLVHLSKLLGNTLLALLVGEALGMSELAVESLVVDFLLGGGGRISTDGLVAGLVHILELISRDTSLDVSGELLVVSLLVLLLEGGHVLSNVLAEDLVAELLRVELLGFTIVTSESLLGVRDIEATIDGTLKAGEDLSTGGSSVETNIKDAAEGSLVLIFLNLDGFTSNLLVALVEVSEVELLKKTSGDEETSAVSGREVG